MTLTCRHKNKIETRGQQTSVMDWVVNILESVGRMVSFTTIQLRRYSAKAATDNI